MTDLRASRVQLEALIQTDNPQARLSRAQLEALIQTDNPQLRLSRAQVEALIQTFLGLTHTTDALLLKVATRTHTTDAFLVSRVTKVHTTDAVLTGGVVSRTHTSDALLKKLSTKVHTTDARLKKTSTRTHTSDALITSTAAVTKTHTSDALIAGLHFFDGFDHVYPSASFTFHGWQAFGFTPDINDGVDGTQATFSSSNSHSLARGSIPNASNVFTMGWAYKPTASTSLTSRTWLSFRNSGTIHVILTIEQIPSGTVSIRRGSASGTILAQTTTGMFTANVYDYWELRAVIDDTVGSVELRKNGVAVATATGVDTRNGGGSPVINDLLLVGITNMSAYWDNIYGSSGGFLGPVKVHTLYPTSDGSPDDWTPSSGSDAYAMLDEVPDGSDEANISFLYDKDTTYIRSTASGDVSVVGYQDLTDPFNVHGVHFTSYARSESGTPTFRHGVLSGGTDLPHTDTTLASTFYTATDTLYRADPDTEGQWTVAAVDALETYVENRTANPVRVTKEILQVLQSFVSTKVHTTDALIFDPTIVVPLAVFSIAIDVVGTLVRVVPPPIQNQGPPGSDAVPNLGTGATTTARAGGYLTKNYRKTAMRIIRRI